MESSLLSSPGERPGQFGREPGDVGFVVTLLDSVRIPGCDFDSNTLSWGALEL
jgi:hypothetical protein